MQAYNATANNKAIEGDIEAIKTYKKIQNDIDDQEALISLITPDQKLVYPFSVLKMNNNLTDLKDQLKNLTDQNPNISFDNYKNKSRWWQW